MMSNKDPIVPGTIRRFFLFTFSTIMPGLQARKSFPVLLGHNGKLLILICSILVQFTIGTAAMGQEAQLKPFTTDGCSAFPDGTLEENALWIECCIRHDFAYWKGGTYSERATADRELEQCIADLGKEELSMLMHVGVRLGGSPFYPTWYRWGYGWPYLRGYKELSVDEQGQIAEQLIMVRDLLNEFIDQTGQVSPQTSSKGNE